MGIAVAIHQDDGGERDGSGSPCLDWWDGLASPLTTPQRSFSVPSPDGAHRTGLTQYRGPGTVDEGHCWARGSLTREGLVQNALESVYTLALGIAPHVEARCLGRLWSLLGGLQLLRGSQCPGALVHEGGLCARGCCWLLLAEYWSWTPSTKTAGRFFKAF